MAKNTPKVITAKRSQKELRKYATKERAKTSSWFFKTGKGQYGEGDVFIGVNNPDARRVALTYVEMSLPEVAKLLDSKVHEDRFVALEILVAKYERAIRQFAEIEQKKIANFYLKHKTRVNNWDLVDTSASYILGHYLFDKNRNVLYKLAKSKSIWDRRIAVVATGYFINKKDFSDILSLAIVLSKDKEDLMHKAVGWMLREVGKKDEKVLTKFLDKYAISLPRTTLRYCIERLSSTQKKHYMKMDK